MTAVKAVLFDMFGVIARLQSPASQAVLERTAGVERERFWAAYWSRRTPYDRGDVTGPAYWKGVCDDLDIPLDERLTAELIAADVASWSEVDQDCVDLIRTLADRGLTLGLLSNIPEELADRYETCEPWLNLFAVVGFSCRIGSAKPEPAAYAWCVHELTLPAGEILFVDDRVDNVAAARELGLQGHVFSSTGALAALFPG